MRSIILALICAITFSSCASTAKKKEEKVNTRAITESVVYEVNLRQHTKEGTINAFRKELPKLKELGVDVVWLMPIFPISEKNRKGSLGSYYSVADYRAVSPEFGTMDDFKALVKEAHSMGMKVILDWVANHTGWDNKLITEHEDWYTHKDGKIVSPVEDWTDTADLNYDNKEMRTYMIESLKFWINEANIDGYRCDMAGMVPTDFWEDARKALDAIKPVYMLAEDAGADLLKKAFHTGYAWELLHLTEDIVEGKKNTQDLNTYFAKIDTLYPKGSSLLNFLTNHDENSWSGTVTERYADYQNAYAAFMFTIPGMPLIYSGQEVGLNHRLLFFEKDSIDWTKNANIREFYTKLSKLKHNNIALASGTDAGKMEILKTDNSNAFVFERSKADNSVIALFNFSKENQTVKIDKITKDYKDFFTGKTCDSKAYELKPGEFHILIK